MSPSARKLTVVLALLLGSVVVGSGLLALEAHLAPFPTPGDPTSFHATVDGLEASTFRWQVFYLPVFQLWLSVSVGLLISGRFAWLENIGASLFVLGLVFIHHATTSMKNAVIFVPIYLVAGMVIATVVRSKWARTNSVGAGQATSSD